MSGDYVGQSIAMMDGKMGTIIRERDEEDRWGVQVPGEEEVRWLSSQEIKDLGGGALIQLPKNNPSGTVH